MKSAPVPTDASTILTLLTKVAQEEMTRRKHKGIVVLHVRPDMYKPLAAAAGVTVTGDNLAKWPVLQQEGWVIVPANEFEYAQFLKHLAEMPDLVNVLWKAKPPVRDYPRYARFGGLSGPTTLEETRVQSNPVPEVSVSDHPGIQELQLVARLIADGNATARPGRHVVSVAVAPVVVDRIGKVLGLNLYESDDRIVVDGIEVAACTWRQKCPSDFAYVRDNRGVGRELVLSPANLTDAAAEVYRTLRADGMTISRATTAARRLAA